MSRSNPKYTSRPQSKRSRNGNGEYERTRGVDGHPSTHPDVAARTCKVFWETGTCRAGDECRNTHVSPYSAAPSVYVAQRGNGRASAPSPHDSRMLPGGRSSTACRDFARRGHCRFGERCKYDHDVPTYPPAGSGAMPHASLSAMDRIGEPHPVPVTSDTATICRDYARSGRCRFGERCKYDHVPSEQFRNGVPSDLHRADERTPAEASHVDLTYQASAETPTESNAPPVVSMTRSSVRAEDAGRPEAAATPPISSEGAAISKHMEAVFSTETFDTLRISKPTLDSIRKVGFSKMTKIQALAIPPALEGIDVMIRAKTGHGKTLAFGIPLVEHLRASSSAQGLVISPTRELALQIKKVFDPLCTEHRFRLDCVIGGTNYKREVGQLRGRRPKVLVATPGRLLALLNDIPDLMANLEFMVLDEADRLLDEGFQRDMEAIFRLLPPDRRNFLASATLPMNLGRYKHMCLRSGYKLVSAMSEESDHQVNSQLEESYVVVTLDDWLAVFWGMLDGYISAGKKVIVFFQAAQATRLMSFILSSSPAFASRVFEIHSRLPQNRRVAELNRFKKAAGGAILCSSDVGARGWDIDDVDAVLQVGMPSDNDTYVHRVGRTARAGSRGEAILLLFDWEVRYFTKRFARIKGLEGETPSAGDRELAGASDMVRRAQGRDGYEGVTAKGYQGLLGFYNSYKRKLGVRDFELVRRMNDWIAGLGRNPPPTLKKRTVGKMQLRGVPGLLVE